MISSVFTSPRSSHGYAKSHWSIFQSTSTGSVHAPMDVPDLDLADESQTAGLERYTQRDHVRFYGLDVVDELTAGEFSVRVLRAGDLNGSRIERHSLVYPTTQEVFLCEAY